MSDKLISQEFQSMSEQELAAAVSVLPSNLNSRTVLFTEAVRVVDYLSVSQSLLPEDKRFPVYDFDILQWGWNLATAHLFLPQRITGAFPLMESTHETRSYATTLLHQFGRSILMRRAAEMIGYGFLKAERTQDGFVVRMADKLSTQFLDIVEFFRLEKLESGDWGEASGKASKDWTRINNDDLVHAKNFYGSYWGKSSGKPLREWIQADVNSLMLPLIHPWDSGHGMMMGYGASPDIDNHFIAEATELVSEWRSEAGIHPEVRFGESTGADISVIGTIIVSLHAKHVRFALLSQKQFPEISVPQSLTIWGPREDLEKSIVDFTGLDCSLVRKAIDAIALHPDDAVHLHRHTTLFRPLLIELGNGLILRPVSSLIRNPFFSMRTLLEWRDPHARTNISLPREEWMRSEIYSLFKGTRYLCVDGSIKVRMDGAVITDIDGAVLDQVSGELALFQIKWQDFFTNDVRQLRSKASNFVMEMNEWASKVDKWTDRLGTNGLAKTLRLKLRKGVSISTIYLFGVSRTAARMQGFGFATSHECLALANWPQFVRVRIEVGPAEHVFQQMHMRLRSDMDAIMKSHPLPVTISVAGKSIQFENLWNAVDDNSH